MRKWCPVCWRELTKKQVENKNITCGKSCHMARLRLARPPCRWCGGPVRRKGRVTCGVACQGRLRSHAMTGGQPAQRPRTGVVCVACGQKKSARGDTCQQCRHAATRQRAAAARASFAAGSGWPGATTICGTAILNILAAAGQPVATGELLAVLPRSYHHVWEELHLLCGAGLAFRVRRGNECFWTLGDVALSILEERTNGEVDCGEGAPAGGIG